MKIIIALLLSCAPMFAVVFSPGVINTSTVTNIVNANAILNIGGIGTGTTLTNLSVVGSNNLVKQFNTPGTGDENFPPYPNMTNCTPNYSGQVGAGGTGGGGVELGVSRSTTKGDWFNKLHFPAGIGTIGSVSNMDTSGNPYVTWYLSGNPSLYGTNNWTADTTLDIVNLNTWGSGCGINNNIVTNNSSGVPGIFSRNSDQFVYVPTNAADALGIDKSVLYGGYSCWIMNYHAGINKGFIIGQGPTSFNPSGENYPTRNRYAIGYTFSDFTLHLPRQVANASTPDNTNNRDVVNIDQLNGTIDLNGGLYIRATNAAASAGGKAIVVQGTGGTTLLISSSDGTDLTIGTSDNTTGVARFNRFFSFGNNSAGGEAFTATTANGGGGLWGDANGNTGLSSQGAGRIFITPTNTWFSNSIAELSGASIPTNTAQWQNLNGQTTYASVTNWNARGMWCVLLQLTDNVGGGPAFKVQLPGFFTNNIRPINIGVAGSTTNFYTFPVNPNTTNSITDTSDSGASITILNSYVVQ